MSESPPAAKSPPTKRTVVDAIVLAFSKSDLKDVVGTDALRTVLEGRYLDMAGQPGTLKLQPVWDLLLSQQGVTADKVIPPLCRLKQWESRLQLAVELPSEVAALGTIQRDRAAQQCKVSEEELAKVLAPPPAVPRAASVSSQKALGKKPKMPVTSGILGAAVVFLALVVGGAVWLATSGGPEAIDPSKVTTELPVKEVRKSADLIGVVLADRAAWNGKSAEDRRRVVANALDRSRRLGAQRLLVMDEKGTPLANAALDAEGKPQVTLQ